MCGIIRNNLEYCFRHIADTILLSKEIPEDIGLFNGKMGSVIFCYQYARITGNHEFEDIAEKLLDRVFEEVNVSTPIYFGNGLAGIGWGIEFLAQNNYIKADTNEVLEDIDAALFKSLRFTEIKSIGFSDGLFGIGFYLLMRVKNPAAIDDSLSTLMVKYYLIFLIDELERRTRDLLDLTREPFTENNVNAPNQFLITAWDFSVLLWFLSELLDQNLFNYKVEKIISRLKQLFGEDSSVPILQINKLLLLLSVERLRVSFASLVNDTRPVTKATVIERLKVLEILNGTVTTINATIDRVELENEISVVIAFSGNSIASVIWIYMRLFMLTSDPGFRDDVCYWANRAEKFYSEYNGSYFEILRNLPELNMFLYSSLGDSFNFEGLRIGNLLNTCC